MFHIWLFKLNGATNDVFKNIKFYKHASNEL